MHRRTPLLLLAFVVGGCANNRLSQTKLGDTEAAMRSAEEIGASDHPEAALHLRYAQDQLEAAKRLIDDGDEERAHRMLDRALIDARLALALARTERERSSAQAARTELEELRSQTVPTSEAQGTPTTPSGDDAPTDERAPGTSNAAPTQETVR